MGAGGGKGSSLVIYNLKLSLLHLNTPLCSCKQRNVYTRGGRRFGNMLSWWKLDKTAALKDMQCWQPIPCALILTLVIICRLAGCIYHQLSGFSCWHSMEKVMERIVRTEKDGAFKDPVWSSTTWGTIPVEREKIMQSQINVVQVLLSSGLNCLEAGSHVMLKTSAHYRLQWTEHWSNHKGLSWFICRQPRSIKLWG